MARPRAHAAFIASLTETAAAAGGAGVRTRWFALGGHTIAIRFAGPALVDRLTRALSHAAAEPTAEPALTIDVWDSRSTQTVMPRPPWGTGDYLEHGRIRGFFDHGLYAVYWVGSRSLSVIDVPSRRAWHWMEAPEDMPAIITAGPFHSILHIWAATVGLQYVHAGAVGDADGCALIVGPGGRGKSSTALACLEHGLGYLADDYCLASDDDPPVAWSLFSSAKLTTDGLARMPSLAKLVDNVDREPDDKAILFLAEHAFGSLIERAPVRALILPRPAAATRVHPATAAEAFAAVGPSTVLQLAGADASTLTALRALCASMPAFHLEAGPDPAAVAAAVHGVLR